jgi:drug/metabolite transporter (DMT)-like permease
VIVAITVAVYVLTGRSLRTTGVGVLPYSIGVYASASATLVPAALYAGAPLWGYSGETWFWLFAVTLGPQILGHTVLNWALRYVEASIVSGTILAEPVVSAVLAWLILSERPGLRDPPRRRGCPFESLPPVAWLPGAARTPAPGRVGGLGG